MFEGLTKIWLDGQLVDEADAKIHVLSHAMHYGTGVFEGVRAYSTERGPAVFRLGEHVDRLLYSGKVIGLEPRHSRAELIEACLEVVRANDLDSAYIRPLLFFGRDTLGVPPRNCPPRAMIAAWKWGRYVSATSPKIQVSDIVRIHPGSLDPRAKVCGHYVNSLLAVRAAHAAGYDEALLMDHEGFVAECSGENVFLVKDGIIKTPPEGSILPGITRETVMQLARDLGMEVVKARFHLDEFQAADEAFMTGTAAEVTAMSQIGDVVLTEGSGPVTAQLQELYQDVVHGRAEQYESFLTRV